MATLPAPSSRTFSTSPDIPRPEHPTPQFQRADWINLNGSWEFEKDPEYTGLMRSLTSGGVYTKSIIVPFAPESSLSGLGEEEFVPCVWYRRNFTVPPGWYEGNKRVLMHFGSVDYDATIWINGIEAFTHRGRHTRFTVDITEFIHESLAENEVVVRAIDNVMDPDQPKGKQKTGLEDHFCSYSRETGITQTVWLESVSSPYIREVKFIPNIADKTLTIQFHIEGNTDDIELEGIAFAEGKKVGSASVAADYQALVLELTELFLWEPGKPFLYDLELTLRSKGKTIDHVTSYFGMRQITIQGDRFLINNKPFFQRLILDQGFYPDGLYTAPTDEALKKDIEIAQAMGFNGARAHQKKFEARYLYWADKLGYLLWGEIGSWGPDYSRAEAQHRFATEWGELLPEYVNHASIVGYIPLNEEKKVTAAFLEKVFQATKVYDPTRPVIDASGYTHGELTDVYDIHPYTPDIEEFRNYCETVLRGEHPEHPTYKGQPFGVMEWGGIFFDPLTTAEITMGESVGYAGVKSGAELVAMYSSFMGTLLGMEQVFASCYTQLYDTEQENNGLYDKNRNPKVDPQLIREINLRPAAYETVVKLKV
jgi:beta-galactosidase/beta-glucuronidase